MSVRGPDFPDFPDFSFYLSKKSLLDEVCIVVTTSQDNQ